MIDYAEIFLKDTVPIQCLCCIYIYSWLPVYLLTTI